MRQQTAIEWLKNKLEDGLISIEMIADNPTKYDHWDDLFEEALEMEKEQMIDIYLAGEAKDKKYYNETYNNNEQ